MFRSRTLYRVVLLLLMCQIAFPVLAQDVNPTPTPPPSTRTLITDVAEAVQTIGIIQFIAAILVIAILIFAWKGLSPLLNAFKDAQKQVAEVQGHLLEFMQQQLVTQQQNNATRQLQAESLAQSVEIGKQTVKAQEGLANIMSQMETKEEAQHDRQSSVQHINEHTDQVAKDAVNAITTEIGTIKRAIDDAAGRITEAKNELEKKLSKEDFAHEMKMAMDEIKEMSQRLTEVRSILSNAEIKPVQDTPDGDGSGGV